MEIREVGKENVGDLFVPCGPNKPSYIREKDYISSLWREERFKKGWRGFVAYEDNKPVGRVEFLPLEDSLILLSGKNLYFMPCIWVLPDFQKRGIGKALMNKVIEETSDRDGIITQATENYGWMPLSFFKKFGFEETDITLFGTIKFIMKKHREDAEPPELLTPTLSHIKTDDKVVVEIVRDNQCPYIRVWENKLKDVLKEFDNKILLKEYETRNRDEALKFGMSTVYVDGEEPFFGSADEKEIREKIREYLKRKGLI